MTAPADTDQLNAVASLLATARDQLDRGDAPALARTLSDLSRLTASRRPGPAPPQRRGHTMTWIKLDDAMTEHPKCVGLSPYAWTLWIHGLLYCSRNLTDGEIPHAMFDRLCALDDMDAAAAELIDAGLWTITEDGSSFAIHDYLKHQRSRETVETERERARNYRAKKGGGTARSADVQRASAARSPREGRADGRAFRVRATSESESESEVDHHHQADAKAHAESCPPLDDDDDHSTVIHNHLRRWALANGKANPVGYARSVIDNHATEFDGIDGVELIQALDDRWPLNPKPRNGTAPTGAVDLGGGDIFLPGSGIVSSGEPERSLSAVAQAALRQLDA